MRSDFSKVAAIVQQAVPRVCPAAQLAIHQNGAVVFTGSYGWLDPETCQLPTQDNTCFDLASVTKLFVTTTFMALVEAGTAALDQPVSTLLPEFAGPRPVQPYEDPLRPGAWVAVTDAPGAVEAGRITFRHLLTHTAGLPAWRPLFQQGDASLGRRMALSSFFSYMPGTRVIYSDIGLILLGMAVERLAALPLDEAVRRFVTKPLKLQHTGYLPAGGAGIAPGAAENIAPTEFCRWRQRRIAGEVHDENAASLGGVSGHAGLFSTASDVAVFGQSFLDATLLKPDTIAEMTKVQAVDGGGALCARRGLGFALWSPDPAASGNPFGQGAYGHTGFTGTSLWIDPERDLVVALLTNEVYYGRENRNIAQLRVQVHEAVVQVVSKATDGDSGHSPATPPVGQPR
jgi:CubicO group peptidase (beta-lactamase class C family)